MIKGFIYVFFATITFSLIEIFLKMVSYEMNPLQLTFIRFFIGSLVLLPFAIRKLRIKNIHLTANDLWFFALTGFIGIVISMFLYQLAVIYSDASTVAVLVASIPVFSVIFSALFFHEKIHPYTCKSMLVNLLGIMFIINPWNLSNNAPGIFLAIASYLFFSLYTIMGKQRIKYYSGAVLTCFSFIMGSFEILCLILISWLPPIEDYLLKSGISFLTYVPLLQGITLKNLPYLLFTGIILTGFGYLFYFLAIESTSTATGSLAFFIKPALAPIFAMYILRETITPAIAIGIFLIIVGSGICFIGDYKKNKMANHSLQEV